MMIVPVEKAIHQGNRCPVCGRQHSESLVSARHAVIARQQGITGYDYDNEQWIQGESLNEADGRITLVNSHGTFTADAYLVELAISRFLSASAENMRQLFKALGHQEDYSDVLWVSEWLVIFASESPEVVENPTFKPPWKR